MSTIPIFDGHNDTLLQLNRNGRSFFHQAEMGHVDLPRATAGGLVGSFFAVWVPDPFTNIDDSSSAASDANQNLTEVSPPLESRYAQDFMFSSFAKLQRVIRASNGSVSIITTVDDFRRNLAAGIFSIEAHLEGADSIDPDLNLLEWLHSAGFRSLGIVWSRPNGFGYGVPIRVSGSPDLGPGLTDLGKALVRTCNELGILVDLSHLNEAGFWDVAKISEKPLVATHSNAHTLAPSVRNLTDRQLDAIRDSDGIVGVNFHCGFLREDGMPDPSSTSYTLIADQVDYLTDRIGIDRVGFGSDFDGAIMPGDLQDAAGLPKIIGELRSRGYDDAALRKIGFENWLRIFHATWQS